MVRIIEGGKERLQAFEGVVIARKGSGIGESFTVRKVSSGIGVHRIFPLHAPTIASIEVLRRGKVRRNKLNYLTKLSGKAARIKEILKNKVTTQKIPQGIFFLSYRMRYNNFYESITCSS